MLNTQAKSKIAKGYKEAVADAVFCMERRIVSLRYPSKKLAWEVCNSINLLSTKHFTAEQDAGGTWIVKEG